jgi:hypothetical protein
LTGTLANGCPYFGPKANEEYKALTGCATVATELDGGVGTHCQHWDGTSFFCSRRGVSLFDAVGCRSCLP